MLLTKSEIKINVLYILSLLCLTLSFYFNIIKDYNFFIVVPITFLFLFLINIMHYNTFSKLLKKILTCINYIFYIWIITNKIYFVFFSEYIIFDRATTTSDTNFIITSILSLSLSLDFILLIVSTILNAYSFKKAKFRVKYLKLPVTLILISLFSASFILNIYKKEIITYLMFMPFYEDVKVSENKPITTEVTNMFDDIVNKTHETNEYTGIAKGRNLIVVQCESLQDVMLNKQYNGYEITPYLNKLIKTDSLYFENCFTQAGWGNTSDAEFVVNNSFYPMPMESVYNKYPTNYYYGLPKILKKNGYNNATYHGYLSEMWNRNVFYPNSGVERYYSFDDFPTNQYIGFGIADKEFFDKTSNYIKNERAEASLENNLEFSFVITLTSHTPYNVSPTMSDINLKDEDKETMFGRYVININYLDSAIGKFIEYLKRDGLYDNSVIVFYGDHQGLNLSLPENYKTMTNFLGKPYSYDDMLNVPFIIHIPGLNKSETISTTCGLMDVLPTTLNILGIENDTIYFGEDVINIPTDSNRVIGGTALLNRGSFIDKDYIFNMSSDSIYEKASIISRETGKEVDVPDRQDFYKRSIKLESDIKLSNTITSRNFIKPLLDGNQIVLNSVNPQNFVYNINSDDDEYNYIERLKEATSAGYKLLNVKVFYENEEFYVNNRYNVFNEITLVDFLNVVKTYPNTFVILSGTSDFITPLFRKLSKEFPNEASIVIPEIYSFEDYQEHKIFGMNTPILSLEKLSYSNEDIINFITNNELFAIKTTTSLYNVDLINMISSHKELFTYVSDVDDNSTVRFYSKKGVNGFYTNNIEFSKYNN